MLAIDTQKLEDDGFCALGRIISQEHLDEFEAQIARFSEAQIHATGTERRGGESFIDIFSRGGAYTDRIYKLLERLQILQAMSHRIGEDLAASGFLNWAGIEVPLIWPDIRVDVPMSFDGLLPVHQDVKSMQCTRAWRLWIALRPANKKLGTVKLYPGTHSRGVLPLDLSDPKKPPIDRKEYAGIEPVVIDVEAGEGILINPMCLHGSVPNRSKLTKFTLMIQVQDYATVIDPDDPLDKVAEAFRTLTAAGGVYPELKAATLQGATDTGR